MYTEATLKENTFSNSTVLPQKRDFYRVFTAIQRALVLCFLE